MYVPPRPWLERLADEHGWEVVEPQSRGGRQIVVRVRDRHVTLYTDEDETGWKLVLRVATPPPGLPSFKITHEGFVSFMAGALGGQDIQVGLSNFDYEYRVQSPEPDELRRVWTLERCQFLLDHVRGAVARASDDEVELEVVRDRFDRDTVPRAMELVVELTYSDVYGLTELRALPGAIARDLDGPHVELDGPSPIVMRPVRVRKHMVTRATMQGVLPAPPPATTKLGDATLAQDGELVTITWSGIERDPVRLIAAVELLRRLSSAPHDGVYR